MCYFTPCSWGSQQDSTSSTKFSGATKESSTSFLAPFPGTLRTSSQGESFTSFLFTFFLVCFVYFAWFCLPLFKKNSSCPSFHLALARHVAPQVRPERS